MTNCKKTFILDTNVILNDPKCLSNFGEHDVIIPFIVLEEIDNFKKGTGALSFAARQFARQLDELRQRGKLQDGVKLNSGGVIRVVKNEIAGVDFIADDHKNDHILLKTAINLSKKIDHVILITKDTLLRVQADGAGIETEDYEASMVRVTDLYERTKTFKVSPVLINKLYKDGSVLNPGGVNCYENEYVKLESTESASQTVLARCEGMYLKRVPARTIGSIEPRNAEQIFAVDALMDPSIQLVTLVGKGGTGKTLHAMNTALEQCGYNQIYEKIVITRSVMPVGRDIGYMPGDAMEKLSYWLGSFYDNLSVVMAKGDKRMRGQEGFEQMQMQGLIEVQPLSHIRGRSIPRSFIIIDEAQNLNQLEIKTIVTRAGEGSKIVALGDPYQIDSPYLDEYSNGLAYLIDKFRGSHLSAHINLVKGERSELAEMAANIL